MATTATNKQPLLMDRVLHEVIESNGLSSGSTTSLDILGTNSSRQLIDCTTNDGAIIEDLYTISRASDTTKYTALFYLSSQADYLRAGEGIYVGKIESSETQGAVTRADLPRILAPSPKVGDDPYFVALYVPKGKCLWTTLQVSSAVGTANTPIIAAQGGYY